MVVQHRPTTGDTRRIEMINAWHPLGSSTLLWAQDMSTGRPLQLVRWGDELYLPVTPGLRLGIGLCNRARTWRAYPTYLEGANIYSGGPALPNACTTNHMWELRPGQHMMLDALMNADEQLGRPLIIVPSGAGFGIGEATFGTTEYRGLIRVYERSSARSGWVQPMAPPPSYPPPGPWPGSGGDLETLRNATGGPVRRSASYKGATSTPGFESLGAGPAPELRDAQPVGIGAGEEEHRTHVETGIRYRADAQLVAGLHVESREDLAEILASAQYPLSNWYWAPEGNRWYATWLPTTPRPTAAQVPVAPGPHWPSGNNAGW